MSEEFVEHHVEPRFSSFVPLTILLAGFLIWFGVQDYSLNTQRSGLNSEIDSMKSQALEAENLGTRYTLLIQDLTKTAQKDENAKLILGVAFKNGLISDAVKVGLLRVQQSAPASTNAPAATPPSK